MIDYTIKDGKLAIDPATLTVAAFNKIWNYDTNPKKTKASNILTYIFTLCDERDRNPFKDVEYDRKDEACRKNAFGDAKYKFTPEEEELVQEAIAWFEYLNSSSVQRLSRSIDKMIEKMAKFLDSHTIDNMVQYKAASDELKKVSDIMKSKALADKTMKEEMNKSRTKADRKRSLLSKGVI
jgi:hypothetical protein